MTLSSPQWLGLTTDIITVISVLFTLAKVYKVRNEIKAERRKREKEEQRKNQPIQIVLKEKHTKRQIYMPNKIRRGELTRAEVMGRLGMIPMKPDLNNPKNKQRRFEIKKNATEEFINNIDSIFVSSKNNPLIILCEKEEMNQFDIQEIKKLDFDIRGFD